MLGENVSAGFIPSVWDELKQTMFISSGYPSRSSSRIKTEYPSIGVFRSSQRIIRLVCVFVQDELRQAQPGELNAVPLNSSQTENALHAIL